MATGYCLENLRKLRPFLHLLLPLCVHLIAEEIIVSVLVDVTTNALCPGRKTCPRAIYISCLRQTVVGIFKMLVLPLLRPLAEDYGPKPLLILIVPTNIIPFTLLAIDQSKGSVYAYYVLRTITYIISHGSIFYISVAFAADVVGDGSQVIGNVLERFLQNNDIFEADVEDDSESFLQAEFGDDSESLQADVEDDSEALQADVQDDSECPAGADLAPGEGAWPPVLDPPESSIQPTPPGHCCSVSVAVAGEDGKKKKTISDFCWITGLFSASQLVGNVLARVLPKDYIFGVSIVLLVFVPVYMTLFLTETERPTREADQHIPFLNKACNVVHKHCYSMKQGIDVVTSSSTLKRISLVSFFYNLGMSGISSVLLFYLKSAFGFNKNQFSEILIVVRVLRGCSTIFSMGLKSFLKIPFLLRLLNPLVGEKLKLCVALLASIAYGLLNGLAWASWVPYLSAPFGVIYTIVKPSTRALISKAHQVHEHHYSEADLAPGEGARPPVLDPPESSIQSSTPGHCCSGNAKIFVAGVQSIASLLSPLAMTPLTTWFLSSNAPFDCKGFSIIFASISMVISLCFAWTLKLDAPSNTVSEDNTGNIEERPVLEDNIEDIEKPLLS